MNLKNILILISTLFTDSCLFHFVSNMLQLSQPIHCTRSQAVARIADRTASSTFGVTWPMGVTWRRWSRDHFDTKYAISYWCHGPFVRSLISRRFRDIAF